MASAKESKPGLITRFTRAFNYVFSVKEQSPTHSHQSIKPTRLKIGSDFITIGWGGKKSDGVDYYEIKFKATGDEFWSRDTTTAPGNARNLCVRGLLQDTEYTFTIIAHYPEREEESSQPSDPIRTLQSTTLPVPRGSKKIQDGKPAIYKLPLKETRKSRNTKFKTRKCTLEPSSKSHCDEFMEKTLMMIGATGSGKSTLIDGMVNYLIGVKWKDNVRFKIIDLTSDEEARTNTPTESQTDWITSYRIHPKNSNAKYICNIIDTPGFGDTRGIERDQQLVSQIRAFFSTKGDQGIETIDAICFVTQAPLARLTHTQRYIYESILSIFGKDMKDNIVAMITFADGKEPPVLKALTQADVPIKTHFLFNNSALFEANAGENCNRFSPMFWDMGSQSFDEFFGHLPLMQTQSLQLTAEVLQTRDQLNVTIEGLLKQIDTGLSNLETMRRKREVVNKYSREIADNEDFTYEVEEYRDEEIPLEPGAYVTNCTFCHFTCHFVCYIKDDSAKAGCAAMKDGFCTACPEKCFWNCHRNNDYRVEKRMKKVQKTYSEMKKKLELAQKGKVTQEELLRSIREKYDEIKDCVCQMIEDVRKYGNYLRENALKSNPLTEVEYLDVMIRSEEQQKQPGFESRIKMLQTFRRTACFKANTVEKDTDELMEEMGLVDKEN